PAGAGDVQFSPAGDAVAFRRGGDLWLASLQGGALRRLTEVGVPPRSAVAAGRYRRNEVEVGPYIWGGPTYAWSKDGARIAVHLVDRTGVREVPFPNYLGDETDPNLVRRSYPGDPNEARRVGVIDVASGALRTLALPDPTATRIAGLAWSTRGHLLIDCESDTAVERALYVLAPGEEQPRLLWRHRRESRVYTTCAAAWHPDSEHVVVLSDLADRYGLYALALSDPTPRLLTDAASDVLGGLTVTDSGVIFYESNGSSPRDRQVCSTTLDGPAVAWTRRGGDSRGYPAPDGATLAVVHSGDTQPPELFLQRAAGAAPQQLTESTPPTFAQRPWSRPRYVSFPSGHDDAVLHARIFEPVDLDRSRRHPVVFGPVYSNTVRDRWGGRYGLLQQLLVAEGYIVVQVDVRGSTGYGRAFREQFLGDFAGRDLDDLESAVDYMERLPYVDPDAIGIWGSSYGGTLTVYSLLKKPGLFDAGVACAAAVDPRFFGGDDVAIVRRPDSLPAAFTRGAAQYADNLEDPLLLIHGMQDQVVPFKTAVDLAEALMHADKDFDFAFAPLATHGWTGRPHDARYLLGKLLAHFDRHLRGR
ncbi:MAG: prolyl oligopeptidase family serine peptidase, partial [Planctomycetota bacterium]